MKVFWAPVLGALLGCAAENRAVRHKVLPFVEEVQILADIRDDDSREKLQLELRDLRNTEVTRALKFISANYEQRVNMILETEDLTTQDLFLQVLVGRGEREVADRIRGETRMKGRIFGAFFKLRLAEQVAELRKADEEKRKLLFGNFTGDDRTLLERAYRLRDSEDPVAILLESTPDHRELLLESLGDEELRASLAEQLKKRMMEDRGSEHKEETQESKPSGREEEGATGKFTDSRGSTRRQSQAGSARRRSKVGSDTYERRRERKPSPSRQRPRRTFQSSKLPREILDELKNMPPLPRKLAFKMLSLKEQVDVCDVADPQLREEFIGAEDDDRQTTIRSQMAARQASRASMRRPKPRESARTSSRAQNPPGGSKTEARAGRKGSRASQNSRGSRSKESKENSSDKNPSDRSSSSEPQLTPCPYNEKRTDPFYQMDYKGKVAALDALTYSERAKLIEVLPAPVQLQLISACLKSQRVKIIRELPAGCQVDVLIELTVQERVEYLKRREITDEVAVASVLASREQDQAAILVDLTPTKQAGVLNALPVGRKHELLKDQSIEVVAGLVAVLSAGEQIKFVRALTFEERVQLIRSLNKNKTVNQTGARILRTCAEKFPVEFLEAMGPQFSDDVLSDPRLFHQKSKVPVNGTSFRRKTGLKQVPKEQISPARQRAEARRRIMDAKGDLHKMLNIKLGEDGQTAKKKLVLLLHPDKAEDADEKEQANTAFDEFFTAWKLHGHRYR